MDKQSLKVMKETLGELKKPVRLVLFKSDLGCAGCSEAQELAQAIKGLSPGKISLEVYDQVMDRDKAEQYGIKVVPTTVVQAGDGRAVRFSGVVEGIFVNVLLDCIRGVSQEREWFPENIRNTLRLLERVVTIRVFVETDCTQCRPMAETAIGLAFENDFISTDIIDAASFPDLIKKHSVKTLPLILFGENIRREGHVTEGEFLELIFKAEGLKEERAKHCLVCGKASPDIICEECKIRIQAEAVDHKLRGEKLKRSDNVV
jgi:alkyl hydroperoxide reductase subunit AhpF